MERKLKLTSLLAGSFLLLGVATAGDVSDRVVVTDEQPGIWNENSASCSCYPYSMTTGAGESEDACTAPAACYQEQIYTKDGARFVAMPEVFGINGSGSNWSRGFIGLQNEDADTGIHFYDGTALRHRIWNFNYVAEFVEDILRISPSFTTGGLSIDQSGHVGVNRGNAAARTHLDVNGVMHLNVYSSAPVFPACSAFDATDGLIALTSRHTFCVCNTSDGGGWRWVNASDGTSACVWQ